MSSAVPASPAVQLRAEDFVLTEGPETTGFTVAPRTSGGEEPSDLRQVASCLDLPVAALETDSQALDQAEGPLLSYQNGRFPRITSSASVLPAEVVRGDRAIFEKDNFASCFKEFLDQEIGAAAEGGTAEIVSADKPATPPPGATGALDVAAKVTDQNARRAAAPVDAHQTVLLKGQK